MQRYEKFFWQSYLEAAVWSSTDSDGTPLDKNFDLSDMSEEALEKSRLACKRFLNENNEYLDYTEKRLEYAGHDFWLTRNHHGAGFWDKPELYGETQSKALTDSAHGFGESDLYVGDDKKLHFYP